MTTKGSNGLRFPENRGISSDSSMEASKVRGCLGSLPSRGNILLLDIFNFVMMLQNLQKESKANYGKLNCDTYILKM